MSRMALTCETNECAGALIASGVNAPKAGQKRRSARGPTSQRMFSAAKARIPCACASAAQSSSSSRRQPRWRQAVHASTSDRTPLGVAHGHDLRDHTAHRRADDMR